MATVISLWLAKSASHQHARVSPSMPERPARAPAGVEFPADEKNKRSTTHVNNGAFEAAIRSVDDVAADAVVKDKRKWRFKYQKHVVKNVEISAQSPDNALKVAEAGLQYLHQNFRFIRGGRSSGTSAMCALCAAPWTILWMGRQGK